jgi:hypothetical protein
MASNSNEGTSTPLEVLEFLKWPLPTMAEEHMLLSDEDVVEGLTAEVALRLMYERDPSEVSQELKARLAFMAAGYTPVTEDGSQALQLLWHTWVSTNLGAPTKWSDAARDYITSGTQLLLGLEPEGAGVDDPSDLQAQDDPPAQLDQDGDVAMGDGGLVAALKKSSGVAIPPHPSLNVGAGSSASGHQQVVRDGVIKLKLDLSMSGSSDPHCFRRIDTVEDGGETLREIRQRWTRCLNQSSKTKTLTLPSVSAEDVTQFLKRVRLEAVKLLENAELGDGIRYPDLDPQHEMVAMVGLRIMETKLVASIQTHLPTPLAWDGLVTAVNTQVSSQRKASYFYALARDVRGRVDYKGGDSKWSTFMNQFRTRFETFAEQMKCEDSAILEQAQVALTFVNLPYNMQDEVIDRTKEKFPGRFFPPTMADFKLPTQTWRLVLLRLSKHKSVQLAPLVAGQPHVVVAKQVVAVMVVVGSNHKSHLVVPHGVAVAAVMASPEAVVIGAVVAVALVVAVMAVVMVVVVTKSTFRTPRTLTRLKSKRNEVLGLKM